MSFDIVREEFEQWSGQYDTDARDRMHYQGHSMVVDKIVQHTHGRAARIVDLGTGTGLVIQGLRMHFPTAVINGYDLSPSMLARCAEKDIADNLVECDLREENWPIPKGKADIVTAAGLLDFIKDPERFLVSTNMLMKTGAIAALTYEVRNLGGKKGPFSASPSCAYFPQAMQQFATSAGFKVIEDQQFQGYTHYSMHITYGALVLQKPAP